MKERKMKIELIKHLSLSTKDEEVKASIDVEKIIPKESLDKVSLDTIANTRKLIEEDIQGIPRSIYLSSKYEHRNLARLRDRIRVNQINNPEFNSFISSKYGRQYYRSIMNSGALQNKTPTSNGDA